jgi:hypothetical protein
MDVSEIRKPAKSMPIATTTDANWGEAIEPPPEMLAMPVFWSYTEWLTRRA